MVPSYANLDLWGSRKVSGYYNLFGYETAPVAHGSREVARVWNRRCYPHTFYTAGSFGVWAVANPPAGVYTGNLQKQLHDDLSGKICLSVGWPKTPNLRHSMYQNIGRSNQKLPEHVCSYRFRYQSQLRADGPSIKNHEHLVPRSP